MKPCVCSLLLALATLVGCSAPEAPRPSPNPADVWLAETYGPERASQGLEEWVIRDFFHDRRGGVFVDVGAADYKTFSNTWYLERELGWSGIAIDALAEYREGYERHRPRTKFFNLFVSDGSSANATLFFGKDKWVSSMDRAFTEKWGTVEGAVDVATVTLDALLDSQHISSFDFLSMDIELAEPKALAGFDIRRFTPALVCVEAHPEVLQEILEYFARNGYVLAAKYLRVDGMKNIWFVPSGTALQPFPQSAGH